MAELSVEYKVEGDLLYVRAKGFAAYTKAKHLKDEIISQMEKMNGRSYKIMFDLRGLTALDPRSTNALGEIDDYLATACKATKIGTVMDSVVAKVQHMRVMRDSKAKYMFDIGRSKIFTDPEECRKWLTAAS